MVGKQIRLFLADGTPGGLTTLEILNWTGRLIGAPRSDLAQLLAREEPKSPGVYLLLGDDQAARDGLRCSIGEADAIESRLREHHGARGKDFWTRVVIVTSKDDNLTKGHTRYLEARLLQIATAAQRCTLDNNTAPQQPPLPEADVSDMEFFIDQLHIALPVLGVDVLGGTAAKANVPASPGSAVPSPTFELTVSKTGVTARAQQIDGEFTVLRDSIVSATVRSNERYAASTKAAYTGYRALQQKLVNDESIRPSTANSACSPETWCSVLLRPQEPSSRAAPATDARHGKPQTAVPSALGRIRVWSHLRECGFDWFRNRRQVCWPNLKSVVTAILRSVEEVSMSNTIDRFGDGIYTPAEVSRYLRVAESTVRNWTGSSGSADRQLVTSGQGFSGHARIPFVGLAEAYVLRAIRQTGVSMQRIRPALVRLQVNSGVGHPLASQQFYTDGVDLLLDIADHSKEETADAVKRLIVVRDGQHVMHEVVQEYLQRVSFRDGFADVVPLPAFGDGTVVADASRGFGQPVFVASGARLVDALDLFAAGEDLTTVSAEYGVPLADLEAALRGQLRTAA